MTKTFYLTTPLYYVNGVPHVGHTYTTVIADTIARYKRMSGSEVCALTGTDEHGLKIERAAREQGMSPRELTDTYAETFKQTWEKMGLHFDEFIRTTEQRHRKAVWEIFERIDKNGFIYLGEYSGPYCVNCEAYAPEDQTACPDCGRPVETMTEESYFFQLSEFQEKLLDFYEDNPHFIIPVTRMNEIVSFVKGGLRDLSISRTSFKWGISLPQDDQHIFYVWFDALTGYLSGVGFGAQPEKFKKHWPADVQLIGKDILRFHAVYWPAFLMAAGLEPPRKLLVNGWWTVEGEKMSKSRGNFITAEELIEVTQPDYIKYFLLREIPAGADGNFSYDLLMHRVNSDLANDLGNLSNRTLKMIENYFSGRIPQPGEPEAGDDELREFTTETVQLYRNHFDLFQIHKAIDVVWELISTINKYIVANEPWVMARDRAQERLQTVLYHCAEALRVVAVMLSPVISDGAGSILRQLGVSKALPELRFTDLHWGGLKPESHIGKIEAVYPRLDTKEFQGRVRARKEERTMGEQEQKKRKEPASTERISIEDFGKVEMHVGKVISAEQIPKSDKLLKIQVDLGSEIRQVVAGIAQEYPADTLAGRLVAVVTNLEPVKLMGVESNGMILAAEDAGKPVLVTFTEPVDVGARLK